MENGEPSINDLLLNADEAWKNNNNQSAIELYQEVLKMDPMQISAYDSLMKIYRKEKAYKKELAIINSGDKSV